MASSKHQVVYRFSVTVADVAGISVGLALAAAAPVALVLGPRTGFERFWVAGLSLGLGLLIGGLFVRRLRTATVFDGETVVAGATKLSIANIERVEEAIAGLLLYSRGGGRPLLVPADPALAAKLRSAVPAEVVWLSKTSWLRTRFARQMALISLLACLYPQLSTHYRYFKQFGGLPADRPPAGFEGLYRGLRDMPSVDDPGPAAGEWVGLGPLEFRLRTSELADAWYSPRGRRAMVTFVDGSMLSVSSARPMVQQLFAGRPSWMRLVLEWLYPFDANGTDESYYAWVYGSTPAAHRWSMPFWEVVSLQAALELKSMELADADGYRLLTGPRLRGVWFRSAAAAPLLPGAEYARFFIKPDRTCELAMMPAKGADRFSQSRAGALVGSSRRRPAPDSHEASALLSKALDSAAARQFARAMLMLASAAGDSTTADADWTLALGQVVAARLEAEPAKTVWQRRESRSLLEALPASTRRDELLARLGSN
ncbi:MAG: hypothetical protein HYY25_04820 [Candidatus Wallbacteria bacterium]|nr:hypothetical protein [Candidatus Wallbacteria bacterium]